MTLRVPSFRRRLFLLPLLLIGVPAGASGPVEVGLSLGSSWYDHLATPSGRTHFSMRTLRPFLRYEGTNAEWRLRGFAQRRYEFYSGDDIDTLFGSGRHSHDRLDLRAVRQWSERDQVELEGGYVRTRDLLEADQATVVADGDRTRWTGGIGTRVELFEGGARIRTTDYRDDEDLADARSVAWNARIVPLRRAEDAVFLGLSDSQLDVAGTTELIQRAASVGYRRHLSPLLTARIEGGAVEARFADGARQRRPLVALGLERDPDRGAALGFALQARFEGDSAAALGAEGRWALASGRAWLRAESLADAEGGIYRHATRTRRFALGIEDTLGRANVLGFEGSYIRTRPLRGEGASSEVLRASGWVLRRVQPWLNLRVAASFLRQPVTAREFEPILRRMRLDAELIVVTGGFGRTAFRGPGGLRSGRAG